MKAVVYREYGSWDVLKVEEVGKPSPAGDEILIRVLAVAINDWDWQMLQGIPFVNRVENGLRRPRKAILGLDIAGRVEAVGNRVTRFKPGDEVYGDISGTWGGFAEYVCVRDSKLALKPAGISFVEAAATSHAANLAVQGLIDVGRIQRGQKILINGAGGGVGNFGIQIAKLYGAEVTGVDNSDKLDSMRSLGYDHVIDYNKEDFTRNGRQYDLILDTKTNRPWSAYLRALSPRGRYVTVGGDTGKLLGGILVMGSLISMFGKKSLRLVILKANKDSAYINGLCDSGKFKPVIDGPYRLTDLPGQMRRFGEGKHRGKIVIEMA
jgi:NADPH:quinone reductase-like Zn-dependent oxidoreductase